MAVVEGPFRYVTEADVGEDACGVPTFPAAEPDFSLYRVGGSGSRTLNTRLIHTYEAGREVALSRNAQPLEVRGAWYTSSPVDVRLGPDWSQSRPHEQNCFRGVWGDTRGGLLRDTRAFNLRFLNEIAVVRGVPPSRLNSSFRTLGNEAHDGTRNPPILRLVPPQGSYYVLGGSMNLQAAQALEDAKVTVELLGGVSNVEGTPPLQMAGVGTGLVSLARNGCLLTTHPDWNGFVRDRLNAARLPGGLYFTLDFNRAVGPGSASYTGVKISLDVVRAVMPIAAVDARILTGPRIWLAPGAYNWWDPSNRTWAFSWINVYRGRPRLRGVGSVIQITVTHTDGTVVLVGTMDFSQFAIQFTLDNRDGYVEQGGTYRPDFRGLDIRAEPQAYGAGTFYSRLFPLVRT